jgi:hypothetical protein
MPPRRLTAPRVTLVALAALSIGIALAARAARPAVSRQRPAYRFELRPQWTPGSLLPMSVYEIEPRRMAPPR